MTSGKPGEWVVPRLAAAAEHGDGVLDRLIAVSTEGERVIVDYPFASAFDRAISVESPAHPHLPERSDAIFTSLRTVIAEIIEQDGREGAMAQGVDATIAANVIYALMRGTLFDYRAAGGR